MKAKRLSLDRISSLPLNIIESILCLVPIQDAAKTSILSRSWRYNWLTIPKLEISEFDFKVTTDENRKSVMEPTFGMPCERMKINKSFKLLYAIYQILLLHRGPIHEFSLSMHADDSFIEIDQIILYLLRNHTLKKFKLDLRFGSYRLPLSIFSFHQLTDLHLSGGKFEHAITKFNGFGSVTSLYVFDVDTDTETLLHLISSCPLLKRLTLLLSYDYLGCWRATIHELFECLRVIEHLTTRGWVIECFAYNGVPRDLPASLPHLKSLCLEDISFGDKYGLPFLLLVTRYSPNIEKIKLGLYQLDEDDLEIESVDYSDIWLENLKELEIEDFSNLKEEMEFVKVILAKSPVLKKVTIYHYAVKDEEVQMLKSLLRAPRASPVVDIIVEHTRDRNRN